MHGIEFHIERIESPLDFSPVDYTYKGEYVKSLVSFIETHDQENGICEYCIDAGWLSPCTYITTGIAQYSEGDRTSYQTRVCDKHLMASVENFRDIGK